MNIAISTNVHTASTVLERFGEGGKSFSALRKAVGYFFAPHPLSTNLKKIQDTGLLVLASENPFMDTRNIGYKILKQIFHFSFFFVLFLFCKDAWSLDLRYKLAMLGYNDQEIANIVYRKKAFSVINSNYKKAMLGYQSANSSPVLFSRETEKNLYGTDFSTTALPYKSLSAGTQKFSPELKSSLLAEASPYLAIVKNAAFKNDIVKSLILAIIKVESGFNSQALSQKGAMGLMQLMPDTASELGVTNPFDPEQNISGGARYLSDCLKTFKDLKLALAAYNAGPGTVAKLQRIPMIEETQKYVRDVLHYKKLYDQLLLREARNR